MRDVGGLPLRDGGPTRPGVLLRSASLHYADPGRRRAPGRRVRPAARAGPAHPPRDRTGRADRGGAGRGARPCALNFLPEDGETLPEADDRRRSGAARLPRLPRRTARRTWWPAVRRLGRGRRRPGPGALRRRQGPHRRAGRAGARRGRGAADAVVADYVLSAERVRGAVPALDAGSPGSRCPADLTPHLPRAEVMAARAGPAGRRARPGRGRRRRRLAARPTGWTTGRLERLRRRLAAGDGPRRLPVGMPRWWERTHSSRRPRWT